MSVVPKTYKGLETLCEFPLETLIPFLGVANRVKVKVLSGQIYIPIREPRLIPFRTSQVCYACGRRGGWWAIQRIKPTPKGGEGAWHLRLCATDGHLMTCDHLVPRSKGGTNDPSNLGTMCDRCNYKKASLSYEEFMQSRCLTEPKR